MSENHKIHYTVDDEPQSTTQKELTPVQIMKNAGINPDKNYLVEIDGPTKKSFKDTPTVPIQMREGMKFVTHFIGPMPVSR